MIVQMLVCLGKSRQTNRLVNEGSDCLVITLKEVQLPQQTHIFIHDANSRCAFDANDPRIVKSVMIRTKADAIPAFVAAALIVNWNNLRALDD